MPRKLLRMLSFKKKGARHANNTATGSNSSIQGANNSTGSFTGGSLTVGSFKDMASASTSRLPISNEDGGISPVSPLAPESAHPNFASSPFSTHTKSASADANSASSGRVIASPTSNPMELSKGDATTTNYTTAYSAIL
eukprot:jgi/Hompol1/7034/HPOL_002969-RA